MNWARRCAETAGMVTADALHRRAKRILPEVIQTSGVILPDIRECGIAALLFPLRRKSNGSLVFRISAQTLANLSNDAAGYLVQATLAREATGRHAKPFAYRQWRRAVLPLGFAGDRDERSRSNHATELEIYFTTKTDGKALLVLVPEERVLVYVWDD